MGRVTRVGKEENFHVLIEIVYVSQQVVEILIDG